MRKLFTSIFLLFCLFSFSQINENAPWMASIKKSLETKEQKTSKLKFQDIVDVGNSFWETEDKYAKGSGYKLFKRWESYWQNFVDENGYLPTGAELFNIWQSVKSKSSSSLKSPQVDMSNWISLGPTTFNNQSYNSANIGRVNVIVKDPNNANILYAGAPAGSLWKSTDSGNTWTSLVDDLPQIGVSAIAIDPNDSNIIYIATGDDDNVDSIGVGVWKSTDAGANWSQTGLNPSNSPSRLYELYIDPSNSNILWLASNNGLYKSTDSGSTWIQRISGHIWDMKLKPGDPNTIYAVSSTNFYKSTNSGTTFTIQTTPWPTNTFRLAIDVTPANTSVVYVLSSHPYYESENPLNYDYEGLYKSTDSGSTFTKTLNTTNIFESTQSWFDMALAVSDTNEDEVYVGVLNIWKTIDGGDSFFKLNYWWLRNAAYTHADIHYLRFFDNELYVGSDGGFFKSSNGGSTFSDYTVGMEISQFYRLSMSQQSANIIAGGTQDNGGFAYAGQWNNYHGGDGMESNVDPNNDYLVYGFMQRGTRLFVSSSSGQSGTAVFSGAELDGNGSGTGEWITPMAVNGEGEIYAGYTQLHRFNDGIWTAISPAFPSNIQRLEIDPLNPDNIYVARGSTLSKSIDRGINFTDIQTFSRNITSIEVNHNNSDIVYVTTSGVNGEVLKSVDGASNFTDLTTGALTGLVKNIVKHRQDDPSNTIYLGTHLGVWRYDDVLADWEEFNINLPNVPVTDLDINIPDNKIVAATYGRGIWISDLAPTTLALNDLKVISVRESYPSRVSCGEVAPDIFVVNNGQNVINSISFDYSVDGSPNQNYIWNGTLNSGNTTTITLPTLSISSEGHTISVEGTIAGDLFSHNNIVQTTFYVNGTGIPQNVNSFENPSDELATYNEFFGTLWEQGAPTGAILNTANTGAFVYGTNLDGNHPDGTKAFLYSRCYDLSILTNPELRFYMAYDLEFDWDILYAEYSTDNGNNWTHLGSASDPNWYNRSRFAGDGLGNNCYNCIGGQWSGTNATMTEYSYDLNSFNSETNFMIRFVFHSDEYTNQEGVIIDDLVIDGTLSANTFQTDQILVYPNPSSNIFNIKLKTLEDISYSVVDVTGKLVLKGEQKDTSGFSINLNQFNTGLYILTLQNENHSISKKLILN